MGLLEPSESRVLDSESPYVITRYSRLNLPEAIAILLATPALYAPFLLLFSPPATAAPQWRCTADMFPDTATQVRAMIIRQGELYVGLGGNLPGNAQVWRMAKSGWVKHLQFEQKKVAVLQTDQHGRLFVGMGTPHSAEQGGPGEAEFRLYDASDNLVVRKEFEEKDVIYSMAWYQDKLHVGTMAEDIPGSAEIWRFDEPGWTPIAGDGIRGWPKDNTYAAIYEMCVHDGTIDGKRYQADAGRRH